MKFLLSLALFCFAQEPTSFSIAVDVNLVLLNTTVRDANGQLVPDLERSHFQIFEDGDRQTLSHFRRDDTPVTIGLVVDHSGSMRSKIDAVLAASRSFVHYSNPDDQMFVVNFNERVFLGLPPSLPFTSSSPFLGAAITSMPANGMTAMYDAIAVALEKAKSGGRDRTVLLVISDGADNASRINLQTLLGLSAQSSALIYTIGVFAPGDPDRNPGVLRKLSNSTGGEAFFPRNDAELEANCQRIAKDIRNQYVLGYTSTQPVLPGVHHKIRVAAVSPQHGKLSVRTRTGYTTMPAR
jgi:Ca-activated chloride channel family protein